MHSYRIFFVAGFMLACMPDDSVSEDLRSETGAERPTDSRPSNPSNGNEEPNCGDGFVDPDEECDDGNRRDGDGCDHLCTEEEQQPRCGDGRVDPGENCDDGNGIDDDDCSNNCRRNDSSGGGGSGSPVGGCLPQGEGNSIGDRLKDLQLTNCNGDVVSLHQFCGSTKAQLVVLSTEWCPSCDRVLPDVESNVQNLGAANLNAFYVMGETAGRVPPTASQCLSYARAKGVDPARMLMDGGEAPNGQIVSFKEILYGDFRGENRGWINACLNGRFGLPLIIVLDGQDYTYVHTDACGEAGQSPHANWVDAVNSLLQR